MEGSLVNKSSYAHETRVSYRVGGGAGIPSQPQFSLPRNLEIEYGYYLHVTERMCHQNVRKFCPRWGQKQSERYINSRFSWGGEGRGGSGGHAPQTPMHGFHTLLSFCYHPVSPPQLKILYETLEIHFQWLLSWLLHK